MNSYYGDNNRWFIATVISIEDPLEMGRVRIRIFGIHSENTQDIPEADLPWAQTVIPVTEGGSSGLGANVGIKPMAQVFGIFLDGINSQLPLVLGSIPKFERSGNQSVSTDSPSTIELTGATYIEQAYNWFISKEGGDFTPEQAAGIIGNLLKESQRGGDLYPLAENPKDAPGGSHGIAQWNKSRYQALLDFSQEKGLDWRSIEAQLQFVTYELFTTEKTALQRLKQSRTAEQAALAFEAYERPAGWTSSTRSLTAADRIKFAEATLEKMETV